MEEMITMIESHDDGNRLTGGETAAKIAAGWTEHVGDVGLAKSYIERECFDARSVRVLIDAGITPDDLALADDIMNVHGMTVGYAHSNGDLSASQIRLALDRGPER